jgi:hypothetical protein
MIRVTRNWFQGRLGQCYVATTAAECDCCREMGPVVYDDTDYAQTQATLRAVSAGWSEYRTGNLVRIRCPDCAATGKQLALFGDSK